MLIALALAAQELPRSDLMTVWNESVAEMKADWAPVVAQCRLADRRIMLAMARDPRWQSLEQWQRQEISTWRVKRGYRCRKSR